MKQPLHDLFDQITMPEETAQRVRASLRTPKKQQAPRQLPRLAAAAAVLAVVLFLTPTVQAAVQKWIVTTFPGLDITIYEAPLKEGEGGTGQIIQIDTEKPTFAHLENGRLYFTGNGQTLDITDVLREDAPYFYQYVDEGSGMTVHLVVGMAGATENFGVYEFVQEPDGEWVAGSGRNFLDPETGRRYPWVKLVWEQLNIPWPMPEEGSF